MIQNSTAVFNTPVRNIKGKVEQYESSILSNTYKYNDRLKSFSVDRHGELGKFFGFGIGQEATIVLTDPLRELNLSNTDSYKLYLTTDKEEHFLNPFPTFTVAEISRDETSNELTIRAIDAICAAGDRIVSELPERFFASSKGEVATYTLNKKVYYTVSEFAAACAELLGINGVTILDVDAAETCFDTFYDGGANFDGTESIREALNAIAEVTQTIYYIDCNDNLVFKRLTKDSDAVTSITKADYFSLQSKDYHTLTEVSSVTELGNNLSAAMDADKDAIQYIRNNPFWELREDVADLLNKALAAIGGLSITQFNCEWRGNYLVEIGDKINLETRDGNITSFLLSDTITYDGALKQTSSWEYEENDGETLTNPSTLGETIKQTFAKVDKINKEISLVASEADANTSAIAALKVNVEGISASVESLETQTSTNISGVQEELLLVKKEVETKITSEEVAIQIKSELENGATKITTHTGFTFDDEGLTIAKSDSDLSTQITENGMTIYNNNMEVLNVKNYGVDAANLHAMTYLLIGENSRFEDYTKDGELRTGCFYVGG